MISSDFCMISWRKGFFYTCSQRKEFAWTARLYVECFQVKIYHIKLHVSLYTGFQAVTLLKDIMGTFFLLLCWNMASSFTDVPLAFKKLVQFWQIFWNYLPLSSRHAILLLTDWMSRDVCFNLGVLGTFLPLEKDEEGGFWVIVSQVACSSPWFKIDFRCESILVLFLCEG